MSGHPLAPPEGATIDEALRRQDARIEHEDLPMRIATWRKERAAWRTRKLGKKAKAAGVTSDGE